MWKMDGRIDEIICGKKSRGADEKINEVSGMISKKREKNCVKIH